MSEENEENEEELNLNEEEETDCEYVYGICMPLLPEGLQPLECVVLIEGIQMETGQPTVTAMGSEGMKPWVAVGLLRMESARLEAGYIYGGSGSGFLEGEEDDEDEDEDYD